MRTCLECGFTYGAASRPALIAALGSLGPEIAQRLHGEGNLLRAQRSAEEWSALEYACHVRDVLLIQRDRLVVALVEETPSFTPMYRDHRVAFDGYNDQDPEVVGDHVIMASALFANLCARLSDEQWRRQLSYNFPSPSRRDVEWMAHHTLQEGVHHRRDIDRLLGRS